MISSSESADPLLWISDLTVSYHRVPAIHHPTLGLGPGHCVGLFGPNGADQSGLLKAIAGLLRPEIGSIRIAGGILEESSPRIAYLPQRESVD